LGVKTLTRLEAVILLAIGMGVRTVGRRKNTLATQFLKTKELRLRK